jgi:hypothetical protein
VKPHPALGTTEARRELMAPPRLHRRVEPMQWRHHAPQPGELLVAARTRALDRAMQVSGGFGNGGLVWLTRGDEDSERRGEYVMQSHSYLPVSSRRDSTGLLWSPGRLF